MLQVSTNLSASKGSKIVTIQVLKILNLKVLKDLQKNIGSELLLASIKYKGKIYAGNRIRQRVRL